MEKQYEPSACGYNEQWNSEFHLVYSLSGSSKEISKWNSILIQYFPIFPKQNITCNSEKNKKTKKKQLEYKHYCSSIPISTNGQLTWLKKRHSALINGWRKGEELNNVKTAKKREKEGDRGCYSAFDQKPQMGPLYRQGKHFIFEIWLKPDTPNFFCLNCEVCLNDLQRRNHFFHVILSLDEHSDHLSLFTLLIVVFL